MRLLRLELSGFKSFGKKTSLSFDAPVTAIVGPNGSGKSNVAEAFRWVLGEQSMKSLRGKRGEDLIWSGAGPAGRAHQASVSVVFDNSEKTFNVDFDEVIITRTVHRDGTNEYAINGSTVRLKDIIELLSGISLGATGHHIISQGEADRILSSSASDRKEMVEEALGLKIYQWKIADSEKKLEKTSANIKEVESLRREIAPHLKFLKKQVEKIEKADEMRRDLKVLYLEYLKREHLYLAKVEDVLKNKKSGPQKELEEVENRLKKAEQALEKDFSESATAGEIQSIERTLRELRSQKDDLGRKLGRLEGLIEIKKEAQLEKESAGLVPVSDIKSLALSINNLIEAKEGVDNLAMIRGALSEIKSLIKNFLNKIEGGQTKSETGDNLHDLIKEKEEAEKDLAKISTEEKNLLDKEVSLKNSLEKERESVRGAEREVFELRAKKVELASALESVVAEERTLVVEKENFKRELEEAKVLVDHEMSEYMRLAPEVSTEEPRSEQENRRRVIEKMKIRLEDMGVEGGDVLQEYKDTTERDEFLEKELVDLEDTATKLKEVSKELKEKLSEEFKTGLAKINKEFNNFFELMFGGGGASLSLIREEKRRRGLFGEGLADEEGDMIAPPEEEGDTKEGIEIDVKLPRKKIKGLQMLSGGERALTSIALLFAMSQVNPPPFLILDETDAALDEANSRKYGDMIANLARSSQLILITHNRETMSRAGVLYGVTMGADGVSKLLSIKFDEASGYAK